MDADRFDDVVRTLTTCPSRRAVLRAVAAATAGLATGFGVAGTRAKKKRGHKFKLNAYGCVDVGKKCYGKNSVCCSGICQGSKKHGTCAAHDVGDCAPGEDHCLESASCNGGFPWACYRTTGNASVCAYSGTCHCGGCKKDKDCEKAFGPGAACIACGSECEGGQGTACISTRL